MAWQLRGVMVETCSCKSVCRCTLGPAEPDQGWCSGGQVYHIEQGDCEGVDLTGARLAVHLQLPGDFLGGVEMGRLYLDETLSAEQRDKIEAIFFGEKGGVWENLKAAIGKWLPSKVAKIEVNAGDSPSYKVGDVGIAKFDRIKTEAGKQAQLVGAPVVAAFQIDSLDLTLAHDSGWSDPEMRQWQSLGHGHIGHFNWSA